MCALNDPPPLYTKEISVLPDNLFRQFGDIWGYLVLSCFLVQLTYIQSARPWMVGFGCVLEFTLNFREVDLATKLIHSTYLSL